MNKAQVFLISRGYNDVVISRQNDALIYVSDVLMEFAQAGTQQDVKADAYICEDLSNTIRFDDGWDD